RIELRLCHEGAGIRVEAVKTLLECGPFVVDHLGREAGIENAPCHLGQDTRVGNRRNFGWCAGRCLSKTLFQCGNATLALRRDGKDFRETSHCLVVLLSARSCGPKGPVGNKVQARLYCRCTRTKARPPPTSGWKAAVLTARSPERDALAHISARNEPRSRFPCFRTKRLSWRECQGQRDYRCGASDDPARHG